MGNVSMSYLFSFSRYQTKCVIKFLFRQLMTSQTLRFILDRAVKQWLTGKKRGKDGNTKISGNNNVTLLCRFFESRVKEHLHKTFAMLSRFWPLRE